jgi:multiple sugar transport system permease protein
MRNLGAMGVGAAVWKVVRFVIIVGLGFIVLFPFFMSVIDGLKSFEDFIDPTVQFIPKHTTMENMRVIFRQIGGFRMDFSMETARAFLENPAATSGAGTNSFMANSYFITFWYATTVALLQVTVCALAGYGFARFKFFGNNLLFFCVILSLVIPPQTLMIPMFIRLRFFIQTGTFDNGVEMVPEYINLIGTFWPGLILAATGLGIKNGLYIFMFRQFFKNMPKELEEASYIDGCNTFQTFYKVMLPSAVALMVTVFLLSFAWQWTDTVYSTLYMSRFQLLANMMRFVSYRDQDVEVMMAMYNSTAAILAVIPVAFVYLVGQKFFVQSVERSGITG